MPSTATSRLEGLTTSVAVKAPCRAATTAAITLSGEQTVGGVALVAGDRVLVKDQASSIDNGIYEVATGAWSRARDFNGALDAVQGTTVFVVGTSAYYRLTSANPVVIGTSALTWLFTGPSLAGMDVFIPEDYGFVGDGVTDDSAAYIALKDAVNAAGGGIVFMRPGATYYIDRYITAANGFAVTDFEFANIEGLIIEGNGATVSMKGDFDRDAATTLAFPIFRVVDSSKISIRNLNVTGNVDLMTNSAVATEPGSYGFFFGSCDDVYIENVHSDLNAADGFQFKENGLNPDTPDKSCQRVTMVNCSARFNARQGISVLQLRSGTFINCDFSFTGFVDTSYTQGGYGTHSPAAGVDVEPNRDIITGPSDVDTGDLTFIDCIFEGNRGAQFISNGGSRRSDGVRLKGGKIIVGSGSLGTDCLIIGGPDFVMEDVFFDGGESGKSILIFYNTPNKGRGPTNIHRNHFSGRFIFSTSGTDADAQITIENNEFSFTSATTFSTAILLNNTGYDHWDFRRNRVFVAKELYVDGGAGDRHICFTQTLGTWELNRYTTDLLAAAGDGGTAHFASSYGTAAIAIDEYYRGTAAGTADTFRPIFNGTQDTNDLFQKLHYRAIVPGVGTTLLGNSDTTINVGRNRSVQHLTAVLTADRAATLAATAGIAYRGQWIIIARTAASTGAFNYNVKNHDGTTLKALTTGTWGRFDFDGTNWFLTSAGSL